MYMICIYIYIYICISYWQTDFTNWTMINIKECIIEEKLCYRYKFSVTYTLLNFK